MIFTFALPQDLRMRINQCTEADEKTTTALIMDLKSKSFFGVAINHIADGHNENDFAFFNCVNQGNYYDDKNQFQQIFQKTLSGNNLKFITSILNHRHYQVESEIILKHIQSLQSLLVTASMSGDLTADKKVTLEKIASCLEEHLKKLPKPSRPTL